MPRGDDMFRFDAAADAIFLSLFRPHRTMLRIKHIVCSVSLLRICLPSPINCHAAFSLPLPFFFSPLRISQGPLCFMYDKLSLCLCGQLVDGGRQAAMISAKAFGAHGINNASAYSPGIFFVIKSRLLGSSKRMTLHQGFAT